MPDCTLPQAEYRASIRDYAIPPWFNPEFQALRQGPVVLREASLFISKFYKEHSTEDFENDLAEYIYSSNAIEDAGLNKPETWRIVKQLLAGEFVEADEELPLRPSRFSKILRRKEVIQHVHAYLYLQKTLSENVLTEAILLEAHKVLLRGIPAARGEQGYQGKYREVVVQVGRPMIEGGVESPVPLEKVEPLMARWIEDFSNFQRNSVKDPIAAAANLKLRFVYIHPFLDRNGRMSRLLFNILLGQHYPHILCIFGENAKERTRYQHAIHQTIHTDNARIFSFYALRRTVKSVIWQLDNIQQSHGDTSASTQASVIVVKLEPIIRKK
ncbi:hypothetical protein TWF192_000283 [Orbilia oligospora]|uniref:Uncharacterized protein n=1 Tax=Orbilia oligospora TaxID=2813651 RepID=A0A6G1MPA9_ORBOL|nr:hypothetical protein TWF191_010398 [Orbilia oligospora]KAF3265639.1 hypothetical protein TWF192_000283 [Orbilia oligospora]